MIKVVLFGACGKMGKVIGKAIVDAEDMQLIGAIDPKFTGEEYGKIISTDKISLNVVGSIDEVKEDFDVGVDFTTAEAAYENIKKVLSKGRRMVVGTTGLSKEMIEEIKN